MIFNGGISFEVWIHLKCTGGLAASVVTVSAVGSCRMNSKESVDESARSVQHMSTHRTKNTKNVAFHLQCQRILRADTGGLALRVHDFA